MTPIPMRFGTDDQFTRVRDLLVRSQYNDQTVKGIAPDGKDPFEPYPNGRIPDELDIVKVLEGLFLRGCWTTAIRLQNLIGAESVADLAALGLIEELASGWRGTVRIRPMYGIYVLSDIWTNEPERQHEMADDVVFPPDIANTQNYLRFLPSDACGNYLEACGGSGVAALLAAKYVAGHAWSVDIAERATEFARFSARLNGLDNFTALAGDTYVPLEGKQFDVIAVHPPYVPVVTHTWIFHDGGDDGERITRRHVEGLPQALAPGGRFFCRCLSSDRPGSTVEQRFRQWLGPAHEEFDVVVLELRKTDPWRMVMQGGLRSRLHIDEMEGRLKRFHELRIETFVSVYVVIQRHEAPRRAFSVRRIKGNVNGPGEFHWLLDWETKKSQACADVILNSVLKPGKVNLHNNYGLENGQWTLAQQFMEVAEPFPLTWEVDPLVSYLLPRIDGTRTGAQIYAGLRQDGALDGNVEAETFARVIGDLVSGGFIVVAGHEPPEAKVDHDPEAE